MRSSQTKALLHSAKMFILGATAIGFIGASGSLALLNGALALIPAHYTSAVDLWCAVYLFLLNCSHSLLSFAASVVAFNPMRLLNTTDTFWPTGLLLIVLGVALLMFIMMVVAITLAYPFDFIGEFRDWLIFIVASNVLLYFSVLFFMMISPQWPTPITHKNVWLYCASYFPYTTAVAHTVVILLLLGQLNEVLVNSSNGPADDTAQLVIATIWMELPVSLVVLAFLSRRNIGAVFTLTGVVAAAVAFGGAWFYAPRFDEWNLPSWDWYAIIATGVPLMLFLGILWRRYRSFFARTS